MGPYGCLLHLTLVRNSVRTTPSASGTYSRDTNGEDQRFQDGFASIQSIATSSATDDAGLFQLRFDDERYLPFEGAGAISSWSLRLNPAVPQFDYSSISDVVVHIKYTAREEERSFAQLHQRTSAGHCLKQFSRKTEPGCIVFSI